MTDLTYETFTWSGPGEVLVLDTFDGAAKVVAPGELVTMLPGSGLADRPGFTLQQAAPEPPAAPTEQVDRPGFNPNESGAVPDSQ